MTNTLMNEFNRLTENKFEYLVLESVDAEIRSKRINVNLIFPEQYERAVRDNEQAIARAFERALMGAKVVASVVVKLTKSHFDEEFFKSRLIEFLNDYPSVSPYVFADEIHIVKNGEYDFSVIADIDEDVYELTVQRKVADAVRKMLSQSYCEKVSFDFAPKKIEKKLDVIEIAEEELKNYIYETADGHYFVPHNVEAFLGKQINERAGYISDATREGTGMVYCGTVSDFTECTRKPKEGESEPPKNFYKFTITDPTGSLKCLYFPRKAEKGSPITDLKNGKQVVIKGALKANTFMGKTNYDMFVNAISLCTLPEDMSVKKQKRAVNAEYKCVFPQPYVERKQATMFDVEVKKVIPRYLLGKTFCVFDLETTGFDTNECKIIEVAAVKVVDGEIKQTFNSFVNPHVPIEERITKLTSITDRDVMKAPDITDVLPDFYKFVGNSTLVGHNVAFDIGFANAAGKDMDIFFENPTEDTWDLSREYVKDLRNYKLGTVLAHFDLVNEHAHRAIYDTIATAKLFIKLAEYRN